jgi:hypothetical protein
VEQWKTKQNSPERDTTDAPVARDPEIAQEGLLNNFHREKIIFLNQGQAKTLVRMWKTIDKENTPPPERRGPRAITPPTDNERRLSLPYDVKVHILDIFIF